MNVTSVDRSWTARSDPAQRPAAAQVARPLPTASPAPQTAVDSRIPVEAPTGADAQLWSVLTSSERTFFARAGGARPITYGPAGGFERPASSGTLVDQRI